MNVVEQVSIRLRHSPALARAAWFWNAVRPVYNKSIEVFGRHGLERNINGTDRVLISPQFRNVPEVYEPETWTQIRNEIRPGDSVADVGAYIGLYTVAFAHMVGPSGKVYAFEPNATNCESLKQHLALNQVKDRVELIRAAVGDAEGTVAFDGSTGIQGHVSTTVTSQTEEVPCLKLDTFFEGRAIDVLKIDVEGYEELVLRGAQELLMSPKRKPRAIFIEVHPYAWPEIGTTSTSLLELLNRYHYQVFDLEGKPVFEIRCYGEIIAYQSLTNDA